MALALFIAFIAGAIAVKRKLKDPIAQRYYAASCTTHVCLGISERSDISTIKYKYIAGTYERAGTQKRTFILEHLEQLYGTRGRARHRANRGRTRRAAASAGGTAGGTSGGKPSRHVCTCQ